MIADDQNWNNESKSDRTLIEHRALLSIVNMDAVKRYLSFESLKGTDWNKMENRLLVIKLTQKVEQLHHMDDLEPNQAYNVVLDLVNYAKILGAKINLEYRST